jgi:hypothetical protein
MFPEPMAREGTNRPGKGKFMQTLAFLWFELDVTQQRLRATFADSQVPVEARNSNSPIRVGTHRCASVKPAARMNSAKKPGTKRSIEPEFIPANSSLLGSISANRKANGHN